MNREEAGVHGDMVALERSTAPVEGGLPGPRRGYEGGVGRVCSPLLTQTVGKEPLPHLQCWASRNKEASTVQGPGTRALPPRPPGPAVYKLVDKLPPPFRTHFPYMEKRDL